MELDGTPGKVFIAPVEDGGSWRELGEVVAAAAAAVGAIDRPARVLAEMSAEVLTVTDRANALELLFGRPATAEMQDAAGDLTRLVAELREAHDAVVSELLGRVHAQRQETYVREVEIGELRGQVAAVAASCCALAEDAQRRYRRSNADLPEWVLDAWRAAQAATPWAVDD